MATKISVIGNDTGIHQNIALFSSLELVGNVGEADIALNLVPLAERAAATRDALERGKHVYSAPPIAACFEEARALADLAQAKGLLLCAGPCTFMGAGVQGTRRLLQEDVIGKPFAAMAQLYRHNDGDWMAEASSHITALMSFLGAVKSVSGMVAGAHRTALLRFVGGEIATVVFSGEAYSMPGFNSIEIFGARGNMSLNNPASYGGQIRIKIGDDGVPPADDNWGGGSWLPIDSPYDIYKEDDSLLVGLADMAAALRDGRTPRANAQQALHVLEVLCAIERSSAEGHEIKVATPFERKPMLSLVAEIDSF